MSSDPQKLFDDLILRNQTEWNPTPEEIAAIAAAEEKQRLEQERIFRDDMEKFRADPSECLLDNLSEICEYQEEYDLLKDFYESPTFRKAWQRFMKTRNFK